MGRREEARSRDERRLRIGADLERATLHHCAKFAYHHVEHKSSLCVSVSVNFSDFPFRCFDVSLFCWCFGEQTKRHSGSKMGMKVD